jgi:hypothetical protein
MEYRTSAGGLNPVWKAGILIDIPEALPVGSTVELVMDWTGLYHGKPMVRPFMIGSVLRNDARGAALRILIHEFRDVRTSVMPSRRTDRTRAVAQCPRWHTTTLSRAIPGKLFPQPRHEGVQCRPANQNQLRCALSGSCRSDGEQQYLAWRCRSRTENCWASLDGQ